MFSKFVLTIIPVILLSLSDFTSIAQEKGAVEKYVINNFNRKKLPKDKFNKVKSLYIENYQSDTFPCSYLLKFENLEYLGIVGCFTDLRVGYHNNLPKLIIDIEKLSQLKAPGKLEIGGFSFDRFPIELCEIKGLKSLSIGSTNIDSIPGAITNFTTLEYLGLQYNRIVEVSSNIGEMTNLRFLDLSNNKINHVPVFESINQNLSIKLSNWPINKADNFNRINFNNESEINKLKILLNTCEVSVNVHNIDEKEELKQKVGPVRSKNLDIQVLQNY